MPSSPSIHPGWLEISIDVHPDAHEALGTFLFDIGCQGIVTEDFENRTLKAYWPSLEGAEELRIRVNTFLLELAGIFPEVRDFTLRLCNLQDRDWAITWRRFFRPDRITPGLMVVPAWDPIPGDLNGAVIRMDPGPAFGTGQHPTTRMCLRTMEKAIPPKPWSMLDVGSGSGILSTYGALLGAARILALDNDPEALRWARKNISLNGLSPAIELSSEPLSTIKERFHLVVANIILGTILELFPCFPALLEPKGVLILSGILRDQVTRVEDALEEHGFIKERTLFGEEWACVLAAKP